MRAASMAPEPSRFASVLTESGLRGLALMEALWEIVAALSAFFAELCASGYSGGGAGFDCALFRLVSEVAPVAAIKAFFFPSSVLLQSA